jgi:hypothetical protein
MNDYAMKVLEDAADYLYRTRIIVRVHRGDGDPDVEATDANTFDALHVLREAAVRVHISVFHAEEL